MPSPFNLSADELMSLTNPAQNLPNRRINLDGSMFSTGNRPRVEMIPPRNRFGGVANSVLEGGTPFSTPQPSQPGNAPTVAPGSTGVTAPSSPSSPAQAAPGSSGDNPNAMRTGPLSARALEAMESAIAGGRQGSQRQLGSDLMGAARTNYAQDEYSLLDANWGAVSEAMSDHRERNTQLDAQERNLSQYNEFMQSVEPEMRPFVTPENYQDVMAALLNEQLEDTEWTVQNMGATGGMYAFRTNPETGDPEVRTLVPGNPNASGSGSDAQYSAGPYDMVDGERGQWWVNRANPSDRRFVPGVSGGEAYAGAMGEQIIPRADAQAFTSLMREFPRVQRETSEEIATILQGRPSLIQAGNSLASLAASGFNSTGFYGQTIQSLIRAGNLPGGVEASDVENALAQLSSAQGRMILPLLQQIGGNDSNEEMQRMESTLPGVGNSMATNLELLAVMIGTSNGMQEYHQTRVRTYRQGLDAYRTAMEEGRRPTTTLSEFDEFDLFSSESEADQFWGPYIEEARRQLSEATGIPVEAFAGDPNSGRRTVTPGLPDGYEP